MSDIDIVRPELPRNTADRQFDAELLLHSSIAKDDKPGTYNLIKTRSIIIMPTVLVKILPHYFGPDAPLVPAMDGDVGVDLYAAEDLFLPPGERALVATGLSIAIPEGYEAQVRPRSGAAIKLGLTVTNSPGTIDPGYRGEVKVIAQNTNPVFTVDTWDALLDVIDGSADAGLANDKFEEERYKNSIRIERGDRIAQMVFARFERPTIRIVEDLPEATRGDRGFGSSGK